MPPQASGEMDCFAALVIGRRFADPVARNDELVQIQMSNSFSAVIVRLDRTIQSVGWVERSETHHSRGLLSKLMGFASLYPSYVRFKRRM
jgi:hypothetical protein